MAHPKSASPARHLSRGVAVVGVSVGALVTGAVGLSAASASTASHTLRLTATQTSDVIVGGVDIASDRDTQNGETTGYDVTSCLVNPNTHLANCDVAVARQHGMIYGHATINVSTGRGSGQVTGGTRGFKGASGTISSAPGSAPDSSRITIVYHS